MAPSPHHNLRSKQGLSDDLKRYLDTLKADIIASFRHELDRVNNSLTTLNDKVQSVEASLDKINSEIQRIDKEMNNLDLKILNVHQDINQCIGGALAEMDNRLARANNIVLRGLDECDGSVDERLANDTEVVGELLNVLNVDPRIVTETKRLGRISANKNRPRLLRISLRSTAQKSEIFRRAKRLKNTRFKNVYVHPDLTPMQRDLNFKLRKEMKERRDQGEDVGIFNGAVRPRSEKRDFRR